jgi:hypothetical protein
MPTGTPVLSVELLAALRTMLEDLCQFWTAICALGEPGAYSQRDVPRVFGEDEDTTAFWPELCPSEEPAGN